MSLIGERSSSFVMKMTPNLSKIQLLSIIAGLTLMRMGVLKALDVFSGLGHNVLRRDLVHGQALKGSGGVAR